MAIWTLWRLDQRRRIRVWCARFPGLLTTPARVVTVVAATAATTLFMALVCGAGLWYLTGAERAGTRVWLVWAGLLVVNVLAGFSMQAVRNSMLVPDAALLCQLPLAPVQIAAARLLAPAAVFAAGTSLVLGGAVTAGAVLAGALPAPAALDVVLWGTAGVVGASVVARSCAMVLYRLALLAPPTWNGLLIPLLGTGRSLLLAAAGIAGFSRSFRPDDALAAVGPGRGGSTLPVALASGGLLVAAAITAAIALWAVRRLDPYTAQLRMATPGTWRIRRPLPRTQRSAILAKDARVLMRRGPQVWELLAGAAVVVPAATACVVAVKALGPSAGMGPFAQAMVTIITASMLGTVLAILGEVLAPVASMDSEGPAGDLLRTVPGALDRLRAVRAGGYTLASTAVGTVLLIIAQLLLGLPASAVVGLAPAVLSFAAVEAAVLVVTSGNHPAPLRPDVMLPRPEPQVRAATMTATAVMVSITGPIAAAIGFVAPDSGFLAVLCCLIALAVAYPAGAALPGLWSHENARDTPVEPGRPTTAEPAARLVPAPLITPRKPMLTFESVTVSYPQADAPALDRVSLTVTAGECVVLGGSNGAGKSTILRTAAGLAEPTTGAIRVGGHPAGSTAARALVGQVADKPPLYDVLSSTEHLDFLSKLWRIAPDTTALIDEFGLEEVAERPVRTLSLGQRQRLALALATLHRPGLLLLDEPFNGLDAATTAFLCGRLRDHLANGGAVLVATHSFVPLDGLATRTLHVTRGHITGEHHGPRALGQLREALNNDVQAPGASR
ncbi:heme ABC exporter ATP-binding protein CcmA [Streptomyces solincola]|uniref:Heme ABC exporter ATP-binding protein CcmA n=1 Tax=Streptomyces solincola TaxID=2100817 RepID=A0A2S9PYZ5_9ACTN|nr:heme ABC exporter ATP-binding protein CcmA [Streptomyces solincola]PRH79646.1 heme ABC exporter ATP-binding protein CcmA [Streptomyces solincola]